MADVAHDLSGPASPKPDDTAPQQASGHDSPDRDKLRIFISYSRDDLDFADQLDAALNTYGFECFIDRQGVSGGEDWKRRLGGLISEGMSSMMADRYFRGGGTSLASIFANMRSIREALGACDDQTGGGRVPSHKSRSSSAPRRRSP
jgi:hypothetical protein